MSIGVILLAGGVGTRMKANEPKQYLLLKGKPIIQYSFDVFLKMLEVTEIVVVCQPEFQHHFTGNSQKKISFALPGERRQDSVQNGFYAMAEKHSLICVHDGVRPFITDELVKRVIDAAHEHGASTAGMPLKYTIKECDTNRFVMKTPDRSKMWEIQTPQVIQSELLEKGLTFARQEKVDVTDDVSFIELLGLPVKIVEGCYTNIKITSPDDLNWSEYILRNSHGV